MLGHPFISTGLFSVTTNLYAIASFDILGNCVLLLMSHPSIPMTCSQEYIYFGTEKGVYNFFLNHALYKEALLCWKENKNTFLCGTLSPLKVTFWIPSPGFQPWW